MVTSYMSTAVFLPISGNNRNAKNDAIKRQDSIVFLYTMLDNIFLRDFCTYFYIFLRDFCCIHYIFPRDFSFLQKKFPRCYRNNGQHQGIFYILSGNYAPATSLFLFNMMCKTSQSVCCIPWEAKRPTLRIHSSAVSATSPSVPSTRIPAKAMRTER